MSVVLSTVAAHASRIRGLSPRRLAARILTIPLEEATPTVRGFEVDDPEVGRRLERIGHTFLHGYHAALQIPGEDELSAELERIEVGWRGFAYEGAGMALALVDWLFLAGRRRGRARLQSFLEGPGGPHRYLVTVGAGWTLARLPRRIGPLLGRLDPVLGWLTLDGYGFHHGFFDWPRSVIGRRRPRRLGGYAARVFDQGLGRSLWFVKGASPRRIAAAVDTFPEARRGDLWSGIGLACCYAGGQDRSAVAELRELAGPAAGELAQGAAFAARARWDAGEVTPATELACRELAGLDSAAAAAVTRKTLQELVGDRKPAASSSSYPGSTPEGPQEPTYETWRRRVREDLAPGIPRPAPGDSPS